MARIWQDGLDWPAITADLTFRYNIQALTLETAGSQWGGGAIHFALNAGYIVTPLMSTPSEIYAGFWFFNEVSPGNNTDFAVAQFVSAQGVECTITYNTLTMVFKLWKEQASSVLLATSSPIILTVGTWHYADIHFLLSLTTSGACGIWIDNVNVMNASGIITSYQGTATTLVGFVHGATTGSFGSIEMTVDDLVFNDTSGAENNARVTMSRITTQLVNSDASPNNGTPLSGSNHFAAVDEAQWSDSNYITLTNTTGQEENFGCAALGLLPLTVFAAQVIAICQKTDAGLASAKVGVTSSANSALSPSTGLPASWGYISGIFELDPNGNIPWVEASLDAADINFTVQ